ncbi:ABC transporter substrate-binding protein [Kiloniella sp. b19]|uniref:ABC transporter substrate-binding protein n=1 Tax=Kiloniella sp. GXU_MW_B19 TaxID=3141326 RepID=UPI0031D1ACF9
MTPATAQDQQTDAIRYLALDADLSGNTREAGQTLQRGIEMALNEINANGGVLGAELRLKLFDHRANPARGIYNVETIAKDEDVLAIIGGVHTPVALAQLPAIHENRIPYLGAWAAGTGVVENGYSPNYVYRLSVRDEYAAPFFLKQIQNMGYKRIALLLEKTGWGLSNEKALKSLVDQTDITITGTHWFFWGATKADFEKHIDRIQREDAQIIILVANATEGAAFVQAMAEEEAPKEIPVLSHWGITAADFPTFAGDAVHSIDLSFLQTWSLDQPGAEQFKSRYCALYAPCPEPFRLPAAVGLAHSYDLTLLIAEALRLNGNLSREGLVAGLQEIRNLEGVIKTYDAPFANGNHEALSLEDIGLHRYNSNGQIVKAQ